MNVEQNSAANADKAVLAELLGTMTVGELRKIIANSRRQRRIGDRPES